MSQRPVIGIPTQTLQAIDGIPEGLPHSWVMNHRYYVVAAAVGGIPFMVPLFNEDRETLRAMYERLDGVFLAGGVDLDPSSYACAREEVCGSTDLPRDQVEIQLARWAIEDGKPVFGICRGMQVINVAAGGTLLQDCATHWPDSIKHDYFPNFGYERDHLAHKARIAEGTRLHEVFGSREIRVNSMHHQAVKRLGAGLVASAFAPDGIIEAVESAGPNYAVGVQWHPEVLIDSDPRTFRLFQSFIQAAAEYGQNRDLPKQLVA